MSNTNTDRTQERTKTSFATPLALLMAPFQFTGSLALGISLLVILLISMAFGTLIEAEYGAAVSKFVIYGNPLFFALIALLAVNLVASIIIRFPWRWYYLPFLTAHVGILILLLGCFLTWQSGEEAQITLPEGMIGTVAVKPEQQQFEFTFVNHSVADSLQLRSMPFRPGPFSWQDYKYENWIRDDRRYKTILWYAMGFAHRDTGERAVIAKSSGNPDIKMEILDYHANSILEPVPPLEMRVLWNKTIQTITELGEAKEVSRNWEPVRLDLRQRHPVPGLSDVRGVNVTMSQGERVSYSLALSPEELTAFQTSRPKGGNSAGLWGEIVLYYGDKNYSINVDQLIPLAADQRFSVEGSGLRIGGVQFSERGPTIRFSVFTQSGEEEAMTLFSDNPELNVQARRLGIFGSYWVDPQRIMQQSAIHAEHPMLQRLAVQRLDFMQGPDKKLYYRFWSGQQIIADGVVPDRKGSEKPLFKLAEQTPDEVEIEIGRFAPQDIPGCRVVSAPVSRVQPNEQRVQLRVKFNGKDDTFWIRAVTPTEQNQIRYIYGNGQTLCVQLNFETIDLGFGILLKQFEKRTEPGTRMPSHFSSLVDFVESKDATDSKPAFSKELDKYRVMPGGEDILISMNRPGHFHGKTRDYRIYQSSYMGPYYPDQPRFHELYDGTVFPWETRPRESISMSTLSVNADPGRGWKYFGCFLIVLGSAMFVWRKHG